MFLDQGGEVLGEHILAGVAAAAPNVEGLNLPAVGVAHDANKGVQVDDRLRTTNAAASLPPANICSPYRFTHAADAMARIVITQCSVPRPGASAIWVIPWCTYTDPGSRASSAGSV